MCLCTDMKAWAKQSAEKLMAQTHNRCPNFHEVKAMWCLSEIYKTAHECVKEMSAAQRAMHGEHAAPTGVSYGK